MLDGQDARPQPPRGPGLSDEQLQSLKRRFDTLKSSTERTNCESHWQQIGEVISPRKIDFVGMRTPGEKRMNQVLDGTGIHSLDLLAAGLHGMATNPAMKWFSLRLVTQRVAKSNGGDGDINEEQTIQKWLSDVENIMWERIYQPGTNFTTALHETYMDLGAFGTAIMFIGQRDDGGLLFESRPLAECNIAENADGKVDTVFRKCSYTVRQLMQMSRTHGWKVSSKVKEMWAQEKYDETVIVVHVVWPREEREPGRKGPKDMPWASCYFEHESCHCLYESGFPEFPYMVPRWSKYAGEVYGRSPGMTALPDVRMLQAMSGNFLKTLHKNADPPMGMRDDGVTGQVRTVPGGITYFRGNPNDSIMLFPTSVQGLGAQAEFMEQLRNRIRTTFFTDILQINTDAEMTATEVMQRTAERMRLLGPLIGRLESELLGPMVDRIFGILMRLGLLPPPPKEIEGAEFTVEYVSPIATAQKQQAVNGMLQVAQTLHGLLGEEGAAQVMMKMLNPMKLGLMLWDQFNCDPDVVQSEEDMAQAAQAEKMQQGMALAQPAVDMAAQSSGAVKNMAQAAQAGGIDVPSLVRALSQKVQESPAAQNDVAQLGERAGEMMGQMGQQAP